jgi:hypothetical protein
VTTRQITFRNVGIEQGSRVWRNSETGVEIIKGKNFKLNGLYYVAVPTRTAEGRMIVATRDSMKGARGAAAYYVDCQMRTSIAKAHTEALLEDSDRNGERLMAVRDVVANRGALGRIPGAVPGGLCVRDTFGREHVTMRIPGQSDQRVTFTSGVSRTRADVADWIVVADFRPGQRTVHYRSPELGYQACGEMYSSDGLTEVRGEVTCQRCRDRYNFDYWEQATAGMPRVPAFTEAAAQ